jgi:hypothetical protein
MLRDHTTHPNLTLLKLLHLITASDLIESLPHTYQVTLRQSSVLRDTRVNTRGELHTKIQGPDIGGEHPVY